MAHCIVSEAEALLDKEFPVLDKGFSRLVDCTGGDARMSRAARAFYGAGLAGKEPERFEEKLRAGRRT